MTPEFERSLNEQMKQAKLTDLMPEFDRDMEWNGLSEKLQPNKKRVLIPVWSYAAAILVLVMGSWFLMKDNTKVSTIEKTAANTPAPTDRKMPEQTIPVNEPVVKEIPVAKTVAHRYTKPSIVKTEVTVSVDSHTPVAQHQPNEIILSPVNDTSRMATNVPQPQIPMAVTKKTRPHTINILDIENEDRKFLTNEEPRGTTSNLILARMQYLISNRDAVVANDKPLLLQAILKK